LALPSLHSFPTRRSSDLVRLVRVDQDRAAAALGAVVGAVVRVGAARRPEAEARADVLRGEDEERVLGRPRPELLRDRQVDLGPQDRKSTRLNSSHDQTSY